MPQGDNVSSRHIHTTRNMTAWSNLVCTFSHPDYTVGLGVSPSQSMLQYAALSCGLDCTGNHYRRSGISPYLEGSYSTEKKYSTKWFLVVDKFFLGILVPTSGRLRRNVFWFQSKLKGDFFYFRKGMIKCQKKKRQMEEI